MFEALHDAKLVWPYGGVLFLLLVSTLIGRILKNRHRTDASRTTIDNLNTRIRAWWKMCAIFAVAILIGRIGSLVLFGIISFLAMREYMTLVPTHRGDHRTLIWSFFVIMPLQYFLFGIQWYGFFAVMIPVLAFVFVPTSMPLPATPGISSNVPQRSSLASWFAPTARAMLRRCLCLRFRGTRATMRGCCSIS